MYKCAPNKNKGRGCRHFFLGLSSSHFTSVYEFLTYNSQSIIFYKFWKSKKRWNWQWRDKDIFRDLRVFTLVKSRPLTADPMYCRNSFGEVRWKSSNDLATCLAPPGSRRERGGAVTVSIQCTHNNDCVTRCWLTPRKVKPRKVNFTDIFNFEKSKMVFSISPRMDL